MTEDFILYKKPDQQGFTFCLGVFRPVHEDSTFREGIVISTFSKDKQLVMLPSFIQRFETANEGLSKIVIENSVAKTLVNQNDEEYTDLVSKGIKEIEAGEMQKVVLARSSSQPLHNLDLGKALDSLAQDNPASFVYLLYSAEFGAWLGATPELLLSVQANSVEAMALAGTLKASNGASFTQKDYDEHAIVAKEIMGILEEGGFSAIRVEGPRIHKAGSVSHLMSRIEAGSTGEVNHFTLANRLHPTSAVSGYPRKKAMAFILENEGLERSLYSGFIGIAKDGAATYYVNLRCGRLNEGSITLFAGAGIVGQSIPEDELAETKAKMGILQKALGLEADA